MPEETAAPTKTKRPSTPKSSAGGSARAASSSSRTGNRSPQQQKKQELAPPLKTPPTEIKSVAALPSAKTVPPPAPPAPPVKTPPPGLVEEAGSPGGEPEDDKVIVMKPPIVVKDLAVRMGLKPFQLVHQLMEMNVFATLTQAIEEDIARKLAINNGFTFGVEKREKGAGQVHKPEKIVEPPKPEPVKEEELKPRPPVITFMGHVDHGKTSLLDAIRKARVAAGEAGGITQHIGAYTVERNNQKITFLDTPGHEAFTAMRARGANVTDIVVIVVAADDGLMPQTHEAINHAKAAKSQIMVAINKVDLPAANIDRVLGQLSEAGLTPETYGGDTVCCEVSAIRGTGVENLLEMMLLQAELLELKAKPNGLARGSVIEAQPEVGRGPAATVLVQQGTLRIGDAILCGPFSGRAKALINDLGQSIKAAGPSTPAKVIGLDGIPTPGEEFTVMRNEREARTVAEERANKLRLGKLEKPTSITLENIFDSVAQGQKKTLSIVLKTDVQGSLEAIIASLGKIESKKIDLHVIHAGVGPISESDVLLARASEAIVVGFNTKTDNAAANASKRELVQIKLFSIIYELLDQVKEAMAGKLDPETRETQIGTALVKQVFHLSKFPVAGCAVQNGRVARNARARVLRRNTPMYDGGVQTLKRFQDDVNEVRAGLECGIRLGDFNDYQEGDIIEFYQLEKVAQSL
jgi:translation initiation factor IF-2